MKRSHTPPRGAKSRARIPTDALPRTSQPEQEPFEAPLQGPLDLQNPEHMRAWLQAMRDAIADLVSLAREGSRRLNHRVLSRAAERSLNGLVDHAENALLER